MARSNTWVAEPPRRSTRNPAPSSLSEVIAQLQADWHALQIVDRAEAIDELLKAKLSRRHIADVLNCSESLVRNYLSVLQASPNDIDLARNGEIGLREIVRRAKSGVQQTESCIEQGYSGAVADPQQGAAVILDWLKAEPAREYYAYAVIQQAIAILDRPKSTARLLVVPLRPGAGINKLIEACRPNRPSEESDGCGQGDSVDQLLHQVSRYGFWLASYVFSLMGDAKICRETLNMALRQVPAPGRNPKL